jgi:ribosomal protein S18 acetylase RimI-like enzyme
MVIELTDPPRSGDVPAHVTVRRFQPGQDDEAVYNTHQEIFGDDLGVPRDRWEDWLEEAFRPEFDPRFWILASVDAEVVGICLGYRSQEAEDAWISIVGVRRPWRRQGIAKALITAAFAEFRRAGRHRVSLLVDADNGAAIELYELLGMRVSCAPT